MVCTAQLINLTSPHRKTTTPTPNKEEEDNEVEGTIEEQDYKTKTTTSS